MKLFLYLFTLADLSNKQEDVPTWRIDLNAEINPATDTGVLFALVSKDKEVPLSLALIDYHFATRMKKQVRSASRATKSIVPGSQGTG